MVTWAVIPWIPINNTDLYQLQGHWYVSLLSAQWPLYVSWFHLEHEGLENGCSNLLLEFSCSCVTVSAEAKTCRNCHCPLPKTLPRSPQLLTRRWTMLQSHRASPPLQSTSWMTRRSSHVIYTTPSFCPAVVYWKPNAPKVNEQVTPHCSLSPTPESSTHDCGFGKCAAVRTRRRPSTGQHRKQLAQFAHTCFFVIIHMHCFCW